MHGRLRNLLDVTNNVGHGPLDYIDKLTLIDYLNMTKIVMGMLSKADLIKLSFDRLMFDNAIQYTDAIDADQMYDLDRNIWSRSDEYTRSVGNFSSYLSADELWGRIRQLPPQVTKRTQVLILCVHSYAQIHYQTQSESDSSSAINPYIDSLMDLNPNLCLLPFLDGHHILQTISNVDSSQLNQVAWILKSLLPKVTLDKNSGSSSNSLWQKMSAKLSKSDKSRVKDISGIIDKYRDICKELHVDKHLRYVISRLPPQTPLLSLLEDKIINRYTNIKHYVDEDDALSQDREIYDSIITLVIALIDAIAVLAAFRTMLLSKELESLRNEATNSLLDVPDKSDLEAFLSEIQPNNI